MTSPVTRRIVATGAHSGLGLEALKKLLDSPFAGGADCHLILFARDPSEPHCQRAKQELSQRSPSSSNRGSVSVDLRRMDLASLPSVRRAAAALCTELQQGRDTTAGFVDVFLLNAAVAKSQRKLVVDEDDRSGQNDQLKDGQAQYETTACVNHVAHLVLLQQLEPAILRFAKERHQDRDSSRRTRIVFTGSALHRSVKDVAVLDELFSSSQHHASHEKWNLMQSYGHSKFLQMLGIRAYRRRLLKKLEKATSGEASGLDLVVVQPGFVPQTGLSRETSWLGRLAMTYLIPLLPIATSLSQAGEWIARACCVDLAEDDNTTFKDSADELQPSHDDGWAERGAIIRTALLEKVGSDQQFGTLDGRTSDTALQDKWWPSTCAL